MDKKTISSLKRKFPALFSEVVKSPILARIASEFDRGRYLYCLLRKKPYFGTVALAGQTWEERKSYMRRLVEQEIKSKGKHRFHLLEIGSWAGDSAVLWADTIKASQCQGRVLCIDPWEPYGQDGKEKINAATILMNRALQKGKVHKLFLHNVAAAGHSDTIEARKGYSGTILPTLEKESFDVVYIDGDHSYSGIKKDLQNSARLLRDGGVLCGDDLDLKMEEIDRPYAEENKEVNMVIDPKTKRTYHPGVCLAVWEFFQREAPSYNGFWAMRKVGQTWEGVQINL